MFSTWITANRFAIDREITRSHHRCGRSSALRGELRSGGERIPVEPRALDLLRHLIVNRDRVVSKEELLDTLWGDRFVGEAALITALRTARLAIATVARSSV
ncbi:MAG: DNA-binding winged helix-turn-helix (wHTH) protein [Acidimicrobiales bacterium]